MESIQLRKLQLEDVAQMVQWEKNEDPLFADYDFPPFNEREQRIWFQSKTSFGKTCFAILQEDTLVGYIAVRKINPATKTAEMGIIIRPLYQNRGIGTRAISLVLEWFFGTRGFVRLFLYVGRYNQKALACYRNLGFSVDKELLYVFGNQGVDLKDPKYQDLQQYFVERNDKVLMYTYKMSISASAYAQENRRRQVYCAE